MFVAFPSRTMTPSSESLEAWFDNECKQFLKVKQSCIRNAWYVVTLHKSNCNHRKLNKYKMYVINTVARHKKDITKGCHKRALHLLNKNLLWEGFRFVQLVAQNQQRYPSKRRLVQKVVQLVPGDSNIIPVRSVHYIPASQPMRSQSPLVGLPFFDLEIQMMKPKNIWEE